MQCPVRSRVLTTRDTTCRGTKRRTVGGSQRVLSCSGSPNWCSVMPRLGGRGSRRAGNPLGGRGSCRAGRQCSVFSHRKVRQFGGRGASRTAGPSRQTNCSAQQELRTGFCVDPKKIPNRANHSRGLSLEISVVGITWLPGRRLGEPARQPSFLRGQQQRERLVRRLQRPVRRQQHRSMALRQRSCSRSSEQRPCGRGERSRDGMASVQRPCSKA